MGRKELPLLEVFKPQLDEHLAGTIMWQILKHQDLGEMTLRLPSDLETMIFTPSITKQSFGPDSAHGCVISKDEIEDGGKGGRKVVCSPAP